MVNRNPQQTNIQLYDENTKKLPMNIYTNNNKRKQNKKCTHIILIRLSVCNHTKIKGGGRFNVQCVCEYMQQMGKKIKTDIYINSLSVETFIVDQ